MRVLCSMFFGGPWRASRWMLEFRSGGAGAAFLGGLRTLARLRDFVGYDRKTRPMFAGARSFRWRYVFNASRLVVGERHQ